MKRLLSLATVLVPCLVAAGAAAEPLRADRVHDFHSVDRFTPQTTFGVSLGYEVWDDDAFFVDTVLGFDLAGHYVSPSGAGGYLVLPLSYLSVEDTVIGPITIEGDSELAIGNIEVGGLYAKALGKRADVVARLGVALPTADDDEVGAAQAYASVPRYGDLVQRWPNTTWLRLSASPMGVAGPLFWRFDLGLDLALAEDDDAIEISPVLRLNMAAGIDLGAADLTAELATNVTSQDSDDADETASTLAVGARFQSGNVQPGIAVILPVGFDDLDDALDLAIAASLTVRVD